MECTYDFMLRKFTPDQQKMIKTNDTLSSFLHQIVKLDNPDHQASFFEIFENVVEEFMISGSLTGVWGG
jgi:hypothetical protein